MMIGGVAVGGMIACDPLKVGSADGGALNVVCPELAPMPDCAGVRVLKPNATAASSHKPDPPAASQLSSAVLCDTRREASL